MKKEITFKGKPLTLKGLNTEENEIVSDFKVVDGELNDVTLSDFKDKVKIITTFLSLDTEVCDRQVKEFNKRATDLSDDAVVLAISKDLPFAQKRFCQANDIKNVRVLSDYRDSSFGLNYGLLIKELNLLARTVLIVDKSNVLRYAEVVDEATDAPDYDAAIGKAQEVLKNPAASVDDKKPKQCTPCEKGTPPLPEDEIEENFSKLSGWQIEEGRKLKKEYKRKNFEETKDLLDLIALLAEEQGHHPDMEISYNKLNVTLTTHAAGGLTDNDFIMAEIIDQLAE